METHDDSSVRNDKYKHNCTPPNHTVQEALKILGRLHDHEDEIVSLTQHKKTQTFAILSAPTLGYL